MCLCGFGDVIEELDRRSRHFAVEIVFGLQILALLHGRYAAAIFMGFVDMQRGAL